MEMIKLEIEKMNKLLEIEKLEIEKINKLFEIEKKEFDKFMDNVNFYLDKFNDIVKEINIKVIEDNEFKRKRLVSEFELIGRRLITLKEIVEKLGLNSQNLFEDLMNLDFAIEGKITKWQYEILIYYREDKKLYQIAITNHTEDKNKYFVIFTLKSYFHNIMDTLKKIYDFDIEDIIVKRIKFIR